MQAQPKKVAQPRPAPPPAAAAKRAGVFSTKEQEAFNAEADALAASLGWSGPADNELNGVAVGDARGYLRKIFHEVHQSALTPERDTPEAEAVCEHLGITDADEAKSVASAIQAAYDREAKEAPANPAMVASNPRVANMSANLVGDVSTLIGKK